MGCRQRILPLRKTARRKRSVSSIFSDCRTPRCRHPVEPGRPKLLDKLPRTQIAPETPGKIRYDDRRLLALYFDMTAMPGPDQLRALCAAQKFVRTQMTPADLMAIMMFSGGAVRVLQDFTETGTGC